MLGFATGSIDYGYPWWLSYGHLPILVAALAIGFLGYARKWSRAVMLVVGAFVFWSGAALLIERFIIDVGGRPELPTQAFLAGGAGRVLDMGAGTGRSSIMVLEARPQATLVALDLFEVMKLDLFEVMKMAQAFCGISLKPSLDRDSGSLFANVASVLSYKCVA